MKFNYTRIVGLALAALFALAQPARAQTLIKGKVTDAGSGQPLEGVTVRLMPAAITGASDAAGNFNFRHITVMPDNIVFSSIGYQEKNLSFADLKSMDFQIALDARNIELNTVTISTHPGDQYKPISKTDIAMRGVNNSQEVLRII
ncbi:MAG TPA: carboxypeptidase-like regulatory domain-containing protein, partial [Puia sp.]|nr:carboxypeptidase-like regulatory domain-containing protein [Puia sp.]